jgi:alpha-glucosidase (family GH31 glycosyl hydrolase)
VLPDFAFGTWFTWWHPYTESEAKGEVERWDTDKLPLDVWAYVIYTCGFWITLPESRYESACLRLCIYGSWKPC